jgi:hypothetical protein
VASVKRRLHLAALRWQYSYERAQAYLAQFTDDRLVVANFESMASATLGKIHRLEIQP